MGRGQEDLPALGSHPGEPLPQPRGDGVGAGWEQHPNPVVSGWYGVPAKGGLGSLGGQNASRAPACQARRMVLAGLCLDQGVGGGWRAQQASLSATLSSLERVCLQLQLVLIIRSEYSSPWAYDKRPEQDGISHSRLSPPLFVSLCVCACVYIFCLFLV